MDTARRSGYGKRGTVEKEYIKVGTKETLGNQFLPCRGASSSLR